MTPAPDGEYGPSPVGWIRDQVELYESSGGTEGFLLMETDMPVVIVTMIGHKSGKTRKVPIMRVEHDGQYAVFASNSGAPENPAWYHNLVADPKVTFQDGTNRFRTTVHLAAGSERQQWLERGIEVFPLYRKYEATTVREIPIFITTPAD